jgi:hypothetical protein
VVQLEDTLGVVPKIVVGAESLGLGAARDAGDCAPRRREEEVTM